MIKVYKFGGTSVGSVEKIQAIRGSYPYIIVVINNDRCILVMGKLITRYGCWIQWIK